MTGQTHALYTDRSTYEPVSLPRLEGRWLRIARVVWVFLALLAALVLITSLPGYLPKFSGQLDHVSAESTNSAASFFAAASALTSLFTAILALGLALILFWRKFEEPAAAALAFYLMFYGIIMAGPMERWSAYWLGTPQFAITLQGLLMATPTIALFALFPNGKFVPDWMRWGLIASIPWSISLFFLAPFTAERINQYPLAFMFAGLFFLVFTILWIYAQIFRYRRVSTPGERQQTKWVVFGFGLWLLYVLISSAPYLYLTSLPPGSASPWWAPMSELGWWLSLSIVPLTLTIAITRFRLWNIDLVINRTLVYGALVIFVLGLYVLTIAGLGLLFESSNSLVIPLIATGAAVLLFQPLRGQLQNGVNRMMYGERDDPASVLTKLGAHLESTATPEATLDSMVETVGNALKLPYVAITSGDEEALVASYGTVVDEVVRLPLIYQGQVVGSLLVAPRTSDGSFSSKDLLLLETIAHQASAVAYNANITADLLRARQRLVSAREEERRRVRRDLHDGLGPQLASLTLKLDAARNLLNTKPEESEQLLGESKVQVQDAVADIRRLVNNLRPPALDELGLMSALRERAATYRVGSGPHVYVEGPERLPSLPAAVEVAAYRIVLEALNNAAQHGSAAHCWVRLSLDRGLTVEVIDDGTGLPEELRAGVGITSMRERTAELGGNFRIEPNPEGGVCIHAWLPFDAEDSA